MARKSPNVEWHESHVSRDDRNELLGFKNKVLWFTGLSGSGKSTIAQALEKELNDKGILTYVLDGDNVRHGLNGDLGFSPEDREENIRRVGEVCKLFYEAGVMVMACFISPYKKDRDKVRELIGDDFVEIYVDCPIDECEKRDSKGLYEKARKGEIKNLTGVNAPYEEPEGYEIYFNTKKMNENKCANMVIKYLQDKKNSKEKQVNFS